MENEPSELPEKYNPQNQNLEQDKKIYYGKVSLAAVRVDRYIDKYQKITFAVQ